MTSLSSIPPFLLSLILKYKYTILFPILVLEGPVATIISGILASPSFKEFNITFLFFFVIFADIFGDTLYYLIGRYAGGKIITRFKKWRGVTDTHETSIQTFFNKYGDVSIILGKITHGIGWPIMMIAGNARVPYKKFIILCASISILKTAFLLAVGYFYVSDFSLLAYYVGSSVATALTVIIVVLIVFFVVSRKTTNK